MKQAFVMRNVAGFDGEGCWIYEMFSGAELQRNVKLGEGVEQRAAKVV